MKITTDYLKNHWTKRGSFILILMHFNNAESYILYNNRPNRVFFSQNHEKITKTMSRIRVCENTTGCLKNHWTKHRLAGTHFDPYSMLIPNMGTIFNNCDFFLSKFKNKSQLVFFHIIQRCSVYEKITGYQKNHWTKHRHPCTHSVPFSCWFQIWASLLTILKYLTIFWQNEEIVCNSTSRVQTIKRVKFNISKRRQWIEYPYLSTYRCEFASISRSHR